MFGSAAKKNIVLLLLLCFSPAALAQSTVSRKALSEYLHAIIARKVERDIALTLESKGFRPEQVQEVITSPEFAGYQHRVAYSNPVTRSIEQHLDRLYDPNFWKLRQKQLQRDSQAQSNLDTLLSLQQALRDKEIAHSGYEDKKEPSPWDRLWGRFKRYILE